MTTEQQAPERFTKKPVTITAIQWTGDNLKAVLDFTGKHHKWADWFADFAAYEAHVKADGNVFKIFTLEGVMDALPGDWIIRGVQGEHYPCKPDIFEATYSPADLAEPTDQSATIARLTAELEQMTAIKGIHQRKRVEYCDRAERFEAKLAEVMAERDAARDEGFAQGNEAAAKVASGWLAAFQGVEIQRTSAREYACDAVMDIADGIRALVPPVDAHKTPVHDRQAGLSLTDDTQTPQADPVREAAQVLLDDDISLSKMAEAVHDGPLGADDHRFSAATKQGAWCLDVVRAALRALAQKGGE